jgi:putative tricarboxylic transport membrane protein
MRVMGSAAGGFIAAVALLPATATAQTAWKPEHAVELVAQSAPGGGTDLTARLIQKIWRTNNILGVASNVVNKAGGGGSVALAYMQRHARDGHYVEVASTALLTSHITGASPYNFTDFTVIAQLASEYLAFAVKPDSPIKSIKDLMDLLHKDPGSISIAIGTAAGGVNNAAAAMVAKAAGADPRKLKSVVFSSSAESATALLGGHVDLVVASASEVMPLLPDRARLLAITAPTRQPGKLASTPTFRELGQDIVVDNSRPVIGPPAMTAAEIAYWDEVFGKTVMTQDWKTVVKESSWADDYLPSGPARKYLEDQYASLKAVLGELGMAN